MKIIGRGQEGNFIVELSMQEYEALVVKHPFYDNGREPIGGDVDILRRLTPTVKFEADASSASHMVAHIREMADNLEKGFEELRKQSPA